ncbi:hypothetical protein JTE90_020317 [Oedothorax gibbosus]|uniref:Uncharacterized protein n=1 Tax=Oedothorax gibbosus TaxID=931172 RepID=A0AAV6VQB1_9ARAC|nr:hypothetical protein JTE90_020317 [Oedothorax gibbosus]
MGERVDSIDHERHLRLLLVPYTLSSSLRLGEHTVCASYSVLELLDGTFFGRVQANTLSQYSSNSSRIRRDFFGWSEA